MSRIIFIRLFIHPNKNGTNIITASVCNKLKFDEDNYSKSLFFFIYFLVEVAFLVAAVLLAF